MVVLAIGAHPDDLELYCFGTLAKLVKQGHTVYTSSVANGDLGNYTIPPAELAEIRCKETSDAAKLIGAEYIPVGVGDLKVCGTDPEQQRLVTELIRRTQPDMIITHCPEDYMPDHVETYKLVFYASFASSIPNYSTATKYHDPVVPMYLMESSMGIGFVPHDYVDITQEQEIKLEAIRCHKSQLEWIMQHDDSDLLHYARVAGEYRGLQCGARYAEAFRRCEVWPRVISQRLLP